MKRVFVDTNHLVALINPKDQWHAAAVKAEQEHIEQDLTITEDVLIELLNFYCEHGDHTRRRVAEYVRRLLIDIRIDVVPRNDTAFLEALELYESRLDKGYSLTDCISMNVCRKHNIAQVLTSDRHFEQEGFEILLRTA